MILQSADVRLPAGVGRVGPLRENKNRTLVCLLFYFNDLMPIAKLEQNRYKSPSEKWRSAFIDEQGVMYHGSEFTAAG
jgi:hypothetical protein